MVKNNPKKCKRKRVRINKDGTLNEKDMEHNKRCQDLYELQDNPWIKDSRKKRTKRINRKRTKKNRKKRTKKDNKKKGGMNTCSQKTMPMYSFSQKNADILKYIRQLGININEYHLLKNISQENGEPIEKLLSFYNQYRYTGLTLYEIVEAYQLGGILEICEDLSECRTLLQSKRESIKLMREQMIKEFCKAKNDTGCVGITSPKFLKFLHYFRPPPPESSDYPDSELLDYVRVWNDCPCGSEINYSSPSVWQLQRSSI
tara:strand:- start:55 stop:831 length:777 start_codon:yes stop_codon:yes gene_type:complete